MTTNIQHRGELLTAVDALERYVEKKEREWNEHESLRPERVSQDIDSLKEIATLGRRASLAITKFAALERFRDAHLEADKLITN